MNYKLIVDYGKPYDEDFNTKEELKAELKRVQEWIKQKEEEGEEYAYFDFSCWNGEEEITEEILSEGVF